MSAVESFSYLLPGGGTVRAEFVDDGSEAVIKFNFTSSPLDVAFIVELSQSLSEFVDDETVLNENSVRFHLTTGGFFDAEEGQDSFGTVTFYFTPEDYFIVLLVGVLVKQYGTEVVE